MSSVVVRRTRPAGSGPAKSSSNGADSIKSTAWYLGKFLCRRVDDGTLERLREHVSRCRGTKTRVRLSGDGWLASGSGLFMQKLKSVYQKFHLIRYILQDPKFVNVLLCVFRLDGMPDGIRYEIVAYKMRDSADVRAIVDRFELLGGDVVVDEDSLVNGGSVVTRSVVRAPGSTIQHAVPMPGRPTNGSVALNGWSGGTGGGGRRYMSQSMGDLTGDVYYGRPVVQRENGGETRRALSTSYDRRGWASETGSIAFFSDTDTDVTNGIATAQVNGRMEYIDDGAFDDLDSPSSPPVRLVYSRPASERDGISYDYSYNNNNTINNTYNRQLTNGGRYRVNGDSASVVQAPMIRSRSVEPLNRYASSALGDSRSDIYGGGRRTGVVKASAVPYQQPTLVQSRFKKQYVQARPVTPASGGPVYRAASRTGGSNYGGTRGYYER